MAGFHDVRLPEHVESGATGGPAFSTNIIELSSGYEKRNIEWEKEKGQWDVSYGIMTKEDFQEVLTFFRGRYGRAYSFRFKDWADYEIAQQEIGTTDGTTDEFQIYKRYEYGDYHYDRNISKPVEDSLTVYVDDVEISEGTGSSTYSIDLLTGVITLGADLAAQSGTSVEVVCEFDVPVRFDSDIMEVSLEVFNAGSVPEISIVEVKGE